MRCGILAGRMRIGEVVAERFELQALAGTGGMGAVYRARDLRTGLVVALKSLRDPGGRHAERFLREAQVLATLNHPNIVRYVEHGRSEGGELYMAMEWIDGQSLSQRIAAANGLSAAETLEVGSQLASALALAHARGIVHRDIKPSNVSVLAGTLSPKLLDFGIARLAEAARLTSNGMMLGTPGYMSPEQARGAAAVSARADVFSLGCLLFKCLAARPPFQGEDMRSLIAQVLFEAAPRVSSVRAEVPPRLDALIARMLAKEPSLRPADGAAVLAELRAIALAVPGANAAGLELPECIGEGELQWICAVLARGPDAAEARAQLRATEQHLPAVRPATAARRRSGSAFELPQAEGEISAEIGTVMDGVVAAPADVVGALRPFDAEVDQLADGAFLTTLGDEPDPVAQARRAVRCAQALQRVRPQLRIAIATGRALRADHPGVGPALDRAAAMLRQVGDGPAGIHLDPTTATLVRGSFAADASTSPAALGGALDPLGPPALPLRGRGRELGRLRDFAERGRNAGRAQWGLLVGAPGVGLTRMLAELRAGFAAGPLSVWAATADPAETHTAFSLVRRLLGAGGLEPSRLEIFDARPHASTTTAPDLVGLLAAILEQAARVRPLLLLLDDLDRADSASLALLARALPPGAPLAVSVLASGRPGLVKRLEPLGVAGELRELEPLGEAACAELAADLGAPKAEDAIRVAAGNPWLLTVLLDASPSAAPAFPEAALARTAARLEALDPEARRALRAVSVWGQEVARGEVAVLLGGAADSDLGTRLEALVAGGWLERVGEGGLWAEPMFRVVQPLVAAAAGAQLTEPDRAIAHRLLAGRLERRANPDALRIASHWEKAGVPERAAEQYGRLAGSARDAGEWDRAAQLAARALPGASDTALRQRLLLISSEAHLWRGELDLALPSATAARSAHPQSSSGFAHAAKIGALAAALAGDVEALAALGESLLLLPVWADANAAFAGAVAAGALAELGKPALAAALEGRLPARPEDAVEPLATAARLHLDATRHARAGQWALAHQGFRAEAQCLLRLGEAPLAALAQSGAAGAQLQGNLVQPALAASRGLFAQAERDGVRVLLPGLALQLARALFVSGRDPDAEPQRAFAEARGARPIQGAAKLLAAERHLEAGKLEDAAREASAAVALLEPEPAHLCAQAVLARVHARRGESAAALGMVRAALARFDAYGEQAGALELRLRTTSAELLLGAGLRDLGRAQLARARERLARELAELEPAWRTAMAASPEVQRLVALAAEWLG